MIFKKSIILIGANVLFAASTTHASPVAAPTELTDKNMKISFEVNAPWNILDGTGEQVSGTAAFLPDGNPNSLQANVAVQKIDYKAGLRAAGQLVAGWLRSNPPTPATFVISKSTLSCTPEVLATQSPCKGSVDGQLTIWAKTYTIDVPVEVKPAQGGLLLLTGAKEIKWGDYGFGDPESTISNLKPVIELIFSIELPAGKEPTVK